MDSHGDVWVADTGNARVDEFSASGTYMGSAWGGYSNGSIAPLVAPAGIAECGDTLYVTDSSAADVQMLTVSGGVYVGKFGGNAGGGKKEGEFIEPAGIACESASSDLYVADKGNNRVQVFNAAGTWLGQFGTAGTGAGQFTGPFSVASGPSRGVYVADSGNKRISAWKANYSTNNPLPTPPSVTENPISTIEYNVPLSGTGLNTLTGSEVAKWAQMDDPVEGTAVFPPDAPMGWPAASYTRATINYVDEHMRTVNVASPTSGISTTEYNEENEVTRSLSADDRAAAEKESNPAAASQLLDTKSSYEEGRLTDTWGPQHTVKLAHGKSEANETVLARNHVHYSYDEGAPTGETYELVTRTVDGAETASHEEFDKRTATTSYSGQGGLGWKLRKPTSVTTDSAGLDLVHSTVYDATTGDVIETKTPASDAEIVYPPVYSTVFGSVGSGEGQMNHPEGVATDAAGNVWVVDSSNNRVEKFSATGGFKASYGSVGSAVLQFSGPQSIAINQTTGNVYVADAGNNRIEELSSAGAFVEVIGWGVSDGKAELEVCKTSCKAGLAGSGSGQFSQPYGIALDSAGNMWVTDGGNNRVQEISEAGGYVSQFGSVGSGNGQLKGPAGIAISEGELYVVDYGNNRVQEFSPGGSYLAQFGSKGGGQGQFNEPVGIAANAMSGNLYVSDATNGRIEEFSPAGKYLAEFASYGNGKGQLNEPTGLAVSGIGEIYIDDQYNSRISAWLPPGAGGARLSYANTFGTGGSGNGQFITPQAPAIDGSGNVWVSDRYNNRVEEFTAAGKFIAAYGTEGTGNGQFNGPMGIDINQSTGNVYVADCGNSRIEELNSTGGFVRSFGKGGTEPGQLSCPRGLKIDSSGNVWVADTYNNRIQEFSSTGSFIAAYGTLGSGEAQFNEPMGITLSGGNLYVADAHNDRVEELSTAGKYLGQFGSEGSGSGQFRRPEAITADSAGNLYVVDNGGANRLEEFTASGTFLASFASSGSGEGQLSEPIGIAINAAGSIYIADSANNRIEQWTTVNEAVHNTKTIYYTAKTEAPITPCQNHPEWIDLPCHTEPASQPGEGMPALAVTHTEYNLWDQPEIITETFGTGEAKTERIKKTTFDEAGRPLTTEETSTKDEKLPKVTDQYNEKTGALETQSTTVSGKVQTITSIANTLGQLESYTDADGNTAKYKLDIDGRPSELVDGSEEAHKNYGYEGSQKYSYDKNTGELTKLEDSALGTFTASYTAGGQMTKESYPNGMSAIYTISPAGQDTALEYKKETSCTEKCAWYTDSVIPSIHGESIKQTSSLSEETYSYGVAGWLNEVQETPAGEGCKTRIYAHEEEGNRTSLTTREPATGGKCATEGGTQEHHTYSPANQLTDPGVTYDPFGNTTALPASDAGGTELTSSYYLDGQLYKQTQNGTTIEYKTDPEDRTRETITIGGAETTKLLSHYDAPGTALAWTVEPTSGKWTRDIPGIDGTLTATATNTISILLLHDLQGDVVAEASPNPTETKLLKTYNSTEYGVPKKGEAPPKYAWLGASGLTSELPSGTITQDGTTYVPQTGRPLQTEQIELPQPAMSINPYVREDAGGIYWGAIAGAQQIAAYWETVHAQEIAATPPGAVPAPGGAGGGCFGMNACAASASDGVDDYRQKGNNGYGCRVWGSWGAGEVIAGEISGWGHWQCGASVPGFEMQIEAYGEGAPEFEGYTVMLGTPGRSHKITHVFPGGTSGQFPHTWKCPATGSWYHLWFWGRQLGAYGATQWSASGWEARTGSCTNVGTPDMSPVGEAGQPS